MIQDYNSNKDIQYKNGNAEISIGFSANNVPPADARNVEKEYDLFLARISAPPRTTSLGGKKFVMVPWSDEEKDAVRPCKDREEAWRVFQERFPNNPRRKHVVTRWWDQYHEAAGKLPESIPEKAAPGSEPVPASKKRAGVYGIPAGLSLTDKKLYDRICYRCRTKGITYEAALVMERPGKGRAKRGKKIVPPESALRKIDSIAKKLQGKPAENVPERSAEPDNAVSCFDRQPPAAPVVELAPKDKVEYIGSPKMFHGVGQVISAKPGYLNVVVDVGNGRMECNRANLAKVA